VWLGKGEFQALTHHTGFFSIIGKHAFYFFKTEKSAGPMLVRR
jgi:hypothetical protein